MSEPHAGFGGTSPTGPSRAPETEDVLIRNHDFQRGYDLEIAATGADGEGVHDERFYLQPGETRSVFDAFDPGVYEVRVVLDGRRTASARVRIDDPTDGVLVEVGNGTVSVHAGLY